MLVDDVEHLDQPVYPVCVCVCACECVCVVRVCVMVGPNFRVGKKIGCGNFGELRLGECFVCVCACVCVCGVCVCV